MLLRHYTQQQGMCMKFSTRTRYGLRFLVHLARNHSTSLIQLGELARAEGISPGYLEQIVRALKPLGILRSARGATGGYALACAPESITLEQIFLHLEGGIAPVACLADRTCPRETICSTRPFWETLDAHIRIFLRDMTLQDLSHTLSQAHTSNVLSPDNTRR